MTSAPFTVRSFPRTSYCTPVARVPSNTTRCTNARVTTVRLSPSACSVNSAVFRALNEDVSRTRTGGFLDPHRFDGKVLHCSKVPYNREAYLAATTPAERRKAFCFCSLVREATDPRIDPIFCYDAAGWARQLWEPVLGVEFSRCTITHSILKGDAFCAWDYHLV